jgi:hypothetical protein
MKRLTSRGRWKSVLNKYSLETTVRYNSICEQGDILYSTLVYDLYVVYGIRLAQTTDTSPRSEVLCPTSEKSSQLIKKNDVYVNETSFFLFIGTC